MGVPALSSNVVKKKLLRGGEACPPTWVKSRIVVTPSGAIRTADRSGSLGYVIFSWSVRPWITNGSVTVMVDMMVEPAGMGTATLLVATTGVVSDELGFTPSRMNTPA